MIRRAWRLGHTATAAAVTLILGTGRVDAQFTAPQRKCAEKIYDGVRKVLQQEAKGNRKYCVKEGIDDVDACIDDEQVKAGEARAKLSDAYACPWPSFGLNTYQDQVADKAEEAADNVIRAIFGDPVTLGSQPSKCNDKLAQRSGQLAVAQWKAFRRCVKDLPSIDDIGDLEGCIVAGIATGTSTKGGKLSVDYIEKCGGEFPSEAADGACNGVGDALFDQCVIDRTECEVCRAAWTAIRSTNPALCDIVDDGSSNASCAVPPTSVGMHTCTLDTGSQIEVENGFNPAPVPFTSGAIDIDCGAISQENGVADCACSVRWPGLSPILLGGAHWLCLQPSVSGMCPHGLAPSGLIDCDGGDAYGGSHIRGFRLTGTCSSQVSCQQACDTYCNDDFVYDAGCEGFCTDGAQSACTTDAQCAGLGEGTCDGPDGVGYGNICDCTCLGTDGVPFGPGGLSCDLAFNLTVEPNPGNGVACDGADVLINLGDTCVPLDTQSSSGVIHDYAVPDLLGPVTGSGMASTCTALADDDLSGLAMTGAAIFYGTPPWSDLLATLSIACE